jgi:hypothetical protein
MIIVYLSSVAPDYRQPIQTSGWSTGGQPAIDVALRLAPVSEEEAREMMEEVKGSRLLRGFRGLAPADVDAVAEIIVQVSQLASDLKDRLFELDINPLMVLEKGKGARVVDAHRAMALAGPAKGGGAVRSWVFFIPSISGFRTCPMGPE